MAKLIKFFNSSISGFQTLKFCNQVVVNLFYFKIMKQLHKKSGRERWVAYSHCLCKLTLCLEAGLSQEDFP